MMAEDLLSECLFGSILDLNLMWIGNLIILKWLRNIQEFMNQSCDFLWFINDLKLQMRPSERKDSYL